MKSKLIFVYNAEGDLFSKVADFAHKIFSPSTYACSLCSLTYDNFGIKKEWADFIKDLDADLEFYHKDEFTSKYKSLNSELPAIFINENGNLRELVNAKIINSFKSLDELKTLIKGIIKLDIK